jgi:GT2 family glycosyltransferase
MTLRHGFTPVDRTPPARAIVPGCSGGTMLLDRAKVLAAGGFDEAYFFYFEDLEFLLRLRTSGHQFVCEERAVVWHDRGVGTVGLSFRGRESYPARRAELVMRNRLLTVFLHYRARTLLVLTPALLAYEAATLCLAVTRGWTAGWLRAWAWQATNRQVILGKRRANAARRVRADRDVLSGGPLPLADGLLQSSAARGAVAVFSGALNAYWRLTRWAVG